jgi:hypothetical protein
MTIKKFSFISFLQVVLLFMILIDGFIKLIHMAIGLIFISSFGNDHAGLFNLANLVPSA